MAPRALSLAVWIALSAAGCSPYAYQKGVQGLQGSVSAIAQKVADSQQQLAADTRLALAADWLNSRPLLQMRNCSSTSRLRTACEIAPRGARPDSSGTATRPLPVAAPVAPPAPAGGPDAGADVCALVAPQAPPLGAPKPNLPPLLRSQVISVLDRYFASMAALVKAQDRAEFDAAAKQVSEAVGQVVGAAASATGSPAAAAIGPLAAAATNVLLWAVGTELDWRRYEMLRRASAEACGSVRVLAQVVPVMLEELIGDRAEQSLNLLNDQVGWLNRARGNARISDTEYAAQLDRAFQTVDGFNALRAIDPQALGRSISKANDQLTLAIWRGDGQFDAMLASSQALADQVNAVNKAWVALAKK